jgi:acetylornithine deacetylase/succinyl-diaminopimelate desuccinylase-like protein
MVDADTPALTVATRGMVFAHLEVRTGERNAHSGMYGGAALNAFHALHRILGAVLPGPDGRLPAPLREGVIEPTEAERAGWATLPPGADQLAEIGARPADPRAAQEFNERTTADASLDVHRVVGGEVRTIVPPVARADLSVRLAPGQDPEAIGAALERLLRDALPDGAELTFEADLASPSRFDPDEPALRLAAEAMERALGTAPAIVRTGGSLPILAAFMERGIAAIVSGFGLPSDNIHAPDESYRIDSLEMGRKSARALYEDLAKLR